MRTFVVCAAVAAVCPAAALAQTVTLTESDALAQLGAESPRIQAARAPVDVARADVMAAGRWPNPRVTFTREAVSGVAEHMLTVAQPLPITGRRQLEVRAATARADASSLRADAQVRRLRADLRLAFTALWVAQDRQRELERSAAHLAELAGLLAKREAAGDAAGFDRLRAERELAEVDASRAAADADRARARTRLGGFLFPAPTPAIMEAVRPRGADAPIPDLEELLMRAEQVRGDLAALARDVEAATFAEQAAARGIIPEPEVVGGTKTSNAGGRGVGSIVGIQVSVPLFDRALPERAAAAARARQARAELEVLRQTTRAEIAAWRVAAIERRAASARHRATLLEGADELERIAQVSYDAGERGILELLDAHRMAATARIRQTDLDAAVREAEIELEAVSGWEIP